MPPRRGRACYQPVLLCIVGMMSFSGCAPGPSIPTTLLNALNGAPVLTGVPAELNSYKAPTLISSLKNASKKDAVIALLHKWLEYQKTSGVSETLRLTDYRIENVAILGYCPPPDKETTVFAAQIEFSVQTLALHPGDWAAFPNATLGDSHWLYHLSPYASVLATGGMVTFVLKGLDLFRLQDPGCS